MAVTHGAKGIGLIQEGCKELDLDGSMELKTLAASIRSRLRAVEEERRYREQRADANTR